MKRTCFTKYWSYLSCQRIPEDGYFLLPKQNMCKISMQSLSYASFDLAKNSNAFSVHHLGDTGHFWLLFSHEWMDMAKIFIGKYFQCIFVQISKTQYQCIYMVLLSFARDCCSSVWPWVVFSKNPNIICSLEIIYLIATILVPFFFGQKSNPYQSD